LERIRSVTLAMGDLVDQAIHRATDALVRRDVAIANEVIRGDVAVNALQADARQLCFTAIITQAPVARDLREIMGFQHMAGELERMGDHCVNIARVARDLADLPPLGDYVDIPKLSQQVAVQVRDILSALVAHDVDRARATAVATKRVLVVEDEDAIRQTLRYNLSREGYAVSEANTGPTALSAARRERPDLILLDLMLPELNGLEVCRVLRQEMSTPILILTAKGSELDKVVGLQVGADDYVTKPFSLNELMARVNALLRRSEMTTRERVDPREIEEFDGFRIDRAARTVHVDGSELRLAPKEFDLLSLLVLNSGRVL